MANLKSSKTEGNLKAAFAGESQANRRYLYFAQKADVEGYNDVAAVFRSTAEGETGHAFGHLEYLEASGDPATGYPIPTKTTTGYSALGAETRLEETASTWTRATVTGFDYRGRGTSGSTALPDHPTISGATSYHATTGAVTERTPWRDHRSAHLRQLGPHAHRY